MNTSSRTKQLPFMERRVPKSDKYSHVQGRLDTGMTVDKVRTVTAREYSRRRDEIFFRLSPTQLFELFCEYEGGDEENLYDSPTYRPSDGPRIVTYSETASPEYSKPYLILDVREEGDFRSCRVLQARSYPSAMIRRDYVLPEMYNFRNKPNCLIIIYCEDERVSAEAAKVLVDRGTDNIFLLSGGMKEFYAQFPTYIEGEVPASFQETRKKTAVGGSRLTEARLRSASAAAAASAPGTARSRLSTGRQSTASDSRSVSAMTGMSTASVAESVISRSTARKGKF